MRAYVPVCVCAGLLGMLGVLLHEPPRDDGVMELAAAPSSFLPVGLEL